MEIHTKIAIVIKNDLLDWQKLNVASFLASSIAIQFPDTHGKLFVNASNSTYLPFINQPIIIYKAETQEEMDRAFCRAKDRGLYLGIYPNALFATKSEAENHIEIGKLTDDNQELVGIVIFGEVKKVNKALNKLKFHG